MNKEKFKMYTMKALAIMSVVMMLVGYSYVVSSVNYKRINNQQPRESVPYIETYMGKGFV